MFIFKRVSGWSRTIQFTGISVALIFGVTACNNITRSDPDQANATMPEANDFDAHSKNTATATHPATTGGSAKHFFLTQRLAVATDSGVIGIAPGTKVDLVKSEDISAWVTDGHATFRVSWQNLTQAPDVAQTAATAYRQSEESASQVNASYHETVAAMLAKSTPTPASLSDSMASNIQPVAPVISSNALNRPAYDLKRGVTAPPPAQIYYIAPSNTSR